MTGQPMYGYPAAQDSSREENLERQEGCCSGWHSSPHHSLHSLHNLLRLHNGGRLQLVCICCGHILGAQPHHLHTPQSSAQQLGCSCAGRATASQQAE